MVRAGGIFVAICIAVIAASLAAAAYLYLALSTAEASMLALAIVIGLGLYNVVTTRLRDRADGPRQIGDLSRGTAALARQVADVSRRVAAMEAKFEAAANSPRTVADPLIDELGELGSLVTQLAETVAAHDVAIKSMPATASPRPAAEAARLIAMDSPPSPRAPAEAAASVIAAAPDEHRTAAGVREAVEAGRIDLYLQPIVTLPQRKVRHYEALSRMRTDGGEVIAAADFLREAEAAGVMGQIDRLALLRSVQLARRLMANNREIGLFCNIAGATLADADFVAQSIELAEDNRALSSVLVFEFPQRTVQGLELIEREALAALAERGFRFSMDRVSDLRFGPRDLSERGFRFVKAPAELLLNRLNDAGGDIHPADLAHLLARFGIDLIASHIESEASVLDLLDFNVRYGQGVLFAPPRPVRQEALRASAEPTEGVARATPVGDDRPPLRAARPGGGRSKGGLLQQGSVRGQLAPGMLDPA
jgi:cyclic-di-GMP phosphodiesterase TipF (flagellum assembly factor)